MKTLTALLPLVAVLLLTQWLAPASSTTLSLWVNSNTTADEFDCGVNNTYPCKSLNFTFARALELAYNDTTIDSLVVFLQAPIIEETVDFEDSNLTFQQIVLRTEEPTTRGWISFSNITVFAPVALSHFDIHNTRLFAWQLLIDNANLYQSTVHGLPYELANTSIPSNTSIIASTFVDTRGIYQGVYINGSHFTNSPVHVMSDTCTVGQSTFVYSNHTSALKTQSCYVSASYFGHNTAENGAAIIAHSHLRVESSIFYNNTAELDGGAIYSYGFLNIFDSTVNANEAINGGGIYITGNSGYFDCTNTEVSSNNAVSGGGIAVIRGTLDVYTGCKTISNDADLGGGVYILNSTVLGAAVWLFDRNEANIGGALYAHLSHIELAGGFTGNKADQGSALYVVECAIELNSAEFINSQPNVTSVALYKSSSELVNWTAVVFMDEGPASFFCDDCENIFCNAKESCDDCPQGCLEFNSSSVCATSHGAKFGCFGTSTCTHVSVNGTLCHCEPGYHGQLCSDKDEQPQPTKENVPTYAIVLIAVGGALVIAIIVYFIVRSSKKKDYKPIE